MFGREAYEHLISETNKMSILSNEESTEMQREIEAKKARVMMLAGRVNAFASNQMQVAEKVGIFSPPVCRFIACWRCP